MTGSKNVVRAFRPFQKPAQPVQLPNRQHAIPAPRQDFVGIGLVARIPDQLVIGRVESIVEGNGELDSPETRAKMASGFRHAVHQEFPHFGRHFAQVVHIHPPQIRG